MVRAPTHVRLGAGAVACLVFLLCAAEARGQAPVWIRSYEDGVEAYQRGDYGRAEQSLRAALKAEPRQSRRKRFVGMQFKAYVPEYYLALVYSRTNRIAEARRLFDRLSTQGLVDQRDPDYAGLVTALSPKESEQQKTASGTGATGTVAQGGAQGTVGPMPGSEPGSKPSEAGTRSEPKPITTPAAPAPVPPRPTESELAIAAGDTALRQRSYGPALDAADRLRQLGDAVNATGLRQRTVAAAMADTAEHLRTNRLPAAEALLRLFEGRVPGSTEVQAARRRLRVAVSERTTLRALLRGQYDAALRSANEAVAANAASARVLFYGACGGAALGLSAGPSGRDQVRAARQMFARARALQPQGFVPERRFISPQVLEALEAP